MEYKYRRPFSAFRGDESLGSRDRPISDVIPYSAKSGCQSSVCIQQIYHKVALFSAGLPMHCAV